MDKDQLLEKWKTIKRKEERENPYDRFIIDEGEFVTIESGVKQLDVTELLEEVKKENDSSNNRISIPKQ